MRARRVGARRGAIDRTKELNNLVYVQIWHSAKIASRVPDFHGHSVCRARPSQHDRLACYWLSFDRKPLGVAVLARVLIGRPPRRRTHTGPSDGAAVAIARIARARLEVSNLRVFPSQERVRSRPG